MLEEYLSPTIWYTSHSHRCANQNAVNLFKKEGYFNVWRTWVRVLSLKTQYNVFVPIVIKLKIEGNSTVRILLSLKQVLFLVGYGVLQPLWST